MKISEHLTAKLPVQKNAQAIQIWSEKKMVCSTREGLTRTGSLGTDLIVGVLTLSNGGLIGIAYFSEEHVDQNV
jgi:hypothetical protein